MFVDWNGDGTIIITLKIKYDVFVPYVYIYKKVI